MTRFEKIEAYGTAVAAEKLMAIIEIDRQRESLILQVQAKAPVISELLDTAELCVKNGIHLGTIEKDSGTRYARFVTDGIRHHLGFAIDDAFYLDRYKNPNPEVGGYPHKIGFAGGGWNGEDFFVDRKGNVVAGQNKRDFIEVAGAFVRNIDEFAEKFYAYVDEICSRKVK